METSRCGIFLLRLPCQEIQKAPKWSTYHALHGTRSGTFSVSDECRRVPALVHRQVAVVRVDVGGTRDRTALRANCLVEDSLEAHADLRKQRANHLVYVPDLRFQTTNMSIFPVQYVTRQNQRGLIRKISVGVEKGHPSLLFVLYLEFDIMILRNISKVGEIE